MIASKYGYADIVSILLEQGTNRSAREKEIDNSLYWASAEGHVDVVRVLLSKGADVGFRGTDRSTVLQVASIKGHEKVVAMLLEAGADVNASSNSSLYCNALQAAVVRGRTKTVGTLLAGGADPNARGGLYRTPLLAAVWKSQTAILQMLLNAGAKVDGGESNSSRVLQAAMAADTSRSDIIQQLLDAGANINDLETKDRGNLLLDASFHKNLRPVHALLQAGVDVDLATHPQQSQSWYRDLLRNLQLRVSKVQDRY